MIGRQIAHFEVTELLGRGGMGEVYRAHDGKLGRDVALKMLPAELGSDAERIARFAREARTLASLSHPNIAAIYGFEESGDERFLVMELAEGEDLATRLERGPLPLDDAIDVARQIATGLEAAHEQNIVHRDLKPANVKITPSGEVKILDFGLARAYQPEAAPEEDPALSPTITAAMTAAGTILGTAAYMSPEQARGKTIDKRADIWAFGVILMELLTGRRLFAGETISDTLADVLRAPVDFDGLPESTPPHILQLLRRCLERDPRKRLRDIGEARLSLSEAAAPEIARTIEPTSSPRPPALLGLALLALVAVAFFGGLYLGRSPAKSSAAVRNPLQAQLLAPEGAAWHLEGADPGPVSISPDGQFAAFSASNGRVMLWLQDLRSGEAIQMPGTERAQYPFWSPDSRKIGFFARGQMQWVSRDGGPPVSICTAFDGKGASWNTDNVILFTPDATQPLHAVRAEGGDPWQVTELNKPERATSHRHPRFLPDGEHFLTTARGYAGGGTAVLIGSLQNGELRMLMDNATQAEFRSGYLLYERESILLARRFDPERFEFIGDPSPVASGVRSVPGALAACFTTSETGRLLIQEGTQTSESRFERHTPQGDSRSLPGGTVSGRQAFDLSRDGRWIVESVLDQTVGTSDLWLLDLDRGIRERITSTPEVAETNPLLFPGARAVAYGGNCAAGSNVWSLCRLSLAEGAQPELLFQLPYDIMPEDVSRDGKWVLCRVQTLDAGYDVWAVSVEDSSASRPLLQGSHDERSAAWSPDGRWFSFASTESGDWQLYVQSFPDGRIRKRVSTSGGFYSCWAPNGSGIYFTEASSDVSFVPVSSSDGGIEIGRQQKILSVPRQSSDIGQFDVFEDGSLLFMTWEGTVEDDRMLLIDNWPSLLEAKR